MEPKFFFDEELNKLPCGAVAFVNHAPWTILYANEMYYSHFACPSLDTLNIIEEDAPKLNSLAPRLRSEKNANLLYRALGKNGDEMRIVMTASKHGENAFLGVLWDATDRSKMIEEVEKEKEKFAVALCNSKNIVFEHHLKKKTQVFYIPDEETNTVETLRKSGVDGVTIPEESVHPDYREFFLANIYNPEEKMLAAKIMLPHDSEYKWYRISRQFEYDEEGNLTRIYGVMINIDEEKRKEKERIAENEIDQNLGVYYRNAAVKKINAYIRQNTGRRDYALLVMDIDNFKSINDTYGHLYGDTVIEMVAGVLRDLRPSFSIPGRYGGDEFFVFLYSSDEGEVRRAADDILVRLSDFRLPDGGNVTCSIGICTGAGFDSAPDYKLMFEKADKALYAAKKNGKAQWKHFSDDMEQSSGRAIDYEVDDEESEENIESKDLMKAFLELSAAAKTSDGAIYSIIKYITAKFDFDWMQVMQVNTSEDLITIRYEWSRDPDFKNNAGKSGYYVHSDIMKFRNHFDKNPIFTVEPENIEGFSPKFSREFEKNKNFNIIYICDTTSDENFYMFTCIRFEKQHEWTNEEMEGLNVATKIMSMFIAQVGKESEREKELQQLVDYDRKTGFYNMGKFYEQLGRLRKLAAENNDEIILFHIDFGNFIPFNRKCGYREGDAVFADFANMMKNSIEADRCVLSHLDGTDMFMCAFRISSDRQEFVERYMREFDIFTKQLAEKHDGNTIFIRLGIYILKPNEDGGIGFDKALEAKKRAGKRESNYYAWYEE